MRVADHREQRSSSLRSPSIDPVGVEDFVAAVLGIRLREHHELDVGRVAAERVKLSSDSRSRRETGRGRDTVRARERRSTAGQQADSPQRLRRLRAERCISLGAAASRVSVIRSCSNGESDASSACDRARSAATSTKRPRSTRRIGSPQTLAMSVAFDAHGEIVPSRGTTYRRWRVREDAARARRRRSRAMRAESRGPLRTASRRCGRSARTAPRRHRPRARAP